MPTVMEDTLQRITERAAGDGDVDARVLVCTSCRDEKHVAAERRAQEINSLHGCLLYMRRMTSNGFPAQRVDKNNSFTPQLSQTNPARAKFFPPKRRRAEPSIVTYTTCFVKQPDSGGPLLGNGSDLLEHVRRESKRSPGAILP